MSAVLRVTAVYEDGTDRRPGVPANPRTTLALQRGSSTTIYALVVRPSGEPLDLDPSWSIFITVKGKPDLPFTLIVRQGVVQNQRGLVRFDLYPGDYTNIPAGRYLWDMWLDTGEERQPLIPTSPLVILASVAAVGDYGAPPPPTPPSPPGATTGEYNCDLIVAVLDCVYLESPSTVGQADADDPGKQPTIGFVIRRPSPTRALVQYYGEVPGFSGLVAGMSYYLGRVPGTIVNDVSGYPHLSVVQRIGFAKSDSVLVAMIDRDFEVL